jgi:hypothetical protein
MRASRDWSRVRAFSFYLARCYKLILKYEAILLRATPARWATKAETRPSLKHLLTE